MFWMVLPSSKPGVGGKKMVASSDLYQDALASSFYLSLPSLFHFQGQESSLTPKSDYSSCSL